MKNQDVTPILLLVGGFVLLNAVSSAFASPKDSYQKQAKSDLDKLASEGVTPTKSNTNFNQLADGIERALTGFGEDEDAIYHIFDQLQNDADLLKLIQAFGERRLLIRKAGLGDWLTDALSPAELSILNQMLSDKGINYRF